MSNDFFEEKNWLLLTYCKIKVITLKITGAIFATTRRKPTSQPDFKKSSKKMALRVGSSMLLRSMRPSRASLISKRAMSEMAFTFAAPNGVHYKDASVKQVDVPSFSGME